MASSAALNIHGLLSELDPVKTPRFPITTGLPLAGWEGAPGANINKVKVKVNNRPIPIKENMLFFFIAFDPLSNM
jgi:hypothetical protein